MWRDLQVTAATLAAFLATADPASAKPPSGSSEAGIELAAGEGLVAVNSACAVCHSLDYIVMNSPFLDASGWEKTVLKMIKVMGAPITPADSAVIVRYLATHYGKGSGT